MLIFDLFPVLINSEISSLNSSLLISILIILCRFSQIELHNSSIFLEFFISIFPLINSLADFKLLLIFLVINEPALPFKLKSSNKNLNCFLSFKDLFLLF